MLLDSVPFELFLRRAIGIKCRLHWVCYHRLSLVLMRKNRVARSNNAFHLQHMILQLFVQLLMHTVHFVYAWRGRVLREFGN